MEPTAHLRWREWEDYSNLGGVLVPIHNAVLQQFWIIGKNESDITLPREVSPCGLYYGRWRDIPKADPPHPKVPS